MTQQQWDQHQHHLDEHIKWPATKAEIIAACGGTDVDPELQEEIQDILPETGKFTKDEFKSMLLTA